MGRRIVTAYLSGSGVERLRDAVEFAWRCDRPLNRFVSINLTKGCIEQHELRSFVSIYFHRVERWLLRKEVEVSYNYVLEHKNDEWLNLHALIHLPPRLAGAFERRSGDWLEQAGAFPGPSVFHTDANRSPNLMDVLRSGRYFEAIEAVLRYMCKGCDPAICARYEIEHRNQGTITGHSRYGCAQAIGPTQRFRDRPDLYKRNGIKRRRHFVLCLPGSHIP